MLAIVLSESETNISFIIKNLEFYFIMSPLSTNASAEMEVTAAEKPEVSHISHVEGAFNVDSQDLPKGYFLRPFFIGTLIASGLSVSAVCTAL